MFDEAHVADDTGRLDRITFTADRCVQRLPKGEYVGQHYEAPFSLGANGLQRQWHTVTIVETPDGVEGFAGRNVIIWE